MKNLLTSSGLKGGGPWACSLGSNRHLVSSLMRICASAPDSDEKFGFLKKDSCENCSF